MTTFIKIPFASSGDKTNPPDTDASGGVNWTQGYPTAYSKDPASDPSAKRIEREEFNGILNRLSLAINEIQTNGIAKFISSADNGGAAFTYSKGAWVVYNGTTYVSKVDTNNTTPPGANWTQVPDAIMPSSTKLVNFVNLTGAANKLPYYTGADTWATTDFTTFGRNLVGNSDSAEARSTLGLGNSSTLNTGSNPGEVVTAASDQPVYNSTLPTSWYTSTDPSGYMGAANVTGGDTLVRLIGLIAHNIEGNWTIVNSYGSHFGTGDSIDPNDAAHVFVSTDGASYTRRWYLYNNGRLRGPAGDFGDMAWVNNKVGTVDGVITLGNGINVKKVNIPDLPPLGYTGTSSRGILSTATVQADSATKAHSIQLNNPGSWGLGMSWGTYVGASGSVDDVAHLLCASDGAAFSRNWWFYNNGNLVGPSGTMASQGWASSNFAPIGSDVAIKDNVEPIKLDDALTFVRNSQTYSWDYKADGRHYVGFITEELKRDNPELVYPVGDMEINGEVIKGVEGTSAGNIAAGYLFPVVKHLLERAESAEAELKDLKDKLELLISQNNAK